MVFHGFPMIGWMTIWQYDITLAVEPRLSTDGGFNGSTAAEKSKMSRGAISANNCTSCKADDVKESRQMVETQCVLGMNCNLYSQFISGWWFGTFFIFVHILGIIIPTDQYIFQRGRSTTNQIWCSRIFNITHMGHVISWLKFGLERSTRVNPQIEECKQYC